MKCDFISLYYQPCKTIERAAATRISNPQAARVSFMSLHCARTHLLPRQPALLQVISVSYSPYTR